MKNENKKIAAETTKQIDDIATVELDNVTGGCAACGNAACCTTGSSAPRSFGARRFGWR